MSNVIPLNPDQKYGHTDEQKELMAIYGRLDPFQRRKVLDLVRMLERFGRDGAPPTMVDTKPRPAD